MCNIQQTASSHANLFLCKDTGPFLYIHTCVCAKYLCVFVRKALAFPNHLLHLATIQHIILYYNTIAFNCIYEYVYVYL